MIPLGKYRTIRRRIPRGTCFAALAVPFPTSAACRFLDLSPVNLRNLQLHLSKKITRQLTTLIVRYFPCFFQPVQERSLFFCGLPEATGFVLSLLLCVFQQFIVSSFQTLQCLVRNRFFTAPYQPLSVAFTVKTRL